MAATASAPEPEPVLIVEDEADLRRVLTFNLREAGFAPDAVGSGERALQAAARSRPAVVVLDLMLPDISGTEVCRRMRQMPGLGDVGILMLTARGDEQDRLEGFEVGADDYVVKPCSVKEVVARVRALARRCSERSLARAADAGRAQTDTGRVKWRGLELDPVRHRIWSDGVELILRPLEFRLIALLLQHPGAVFTREQPLERVWDMPPGIGSRTVDTHVRRLRQRLGTYGDAVETVHGFGYRLRET